MEKVFFDDNPAERELVKEFLPEVEVIDTQEDPALYISELDRARCFDWAQLTLEDVERSASFVQNKKRIQLQKSIVDYDDYLKMSDSIKVNILEIIKRLDYSEKYRVVISSIAHHLILDLYKICKSALDFEMELEDNSLFIMGGASQKYYSHEIPKSESKDTRYSLTFREFIY